MRSRSAHLQQARGNRALAQQLLQAHRADPVALQWVATMAFYCAVHCVEAHLATHGAHSADHRDRENRMADPRFGIPPDVFTAYRRLKYWSHQARYLHGRFSDQHVEQVVLNRTLARVTALVNA